MPALAIVERLQIVEELGPWAVAGGSALLVVRGRRGVGLGNIRFPAVIIGMVGHVRRTWQANKS